MPIDFSNVNVTIQQFQKIASGKYNAGEIRLTGRTSLGKVANGFPKEFRFPSVSVKTTANYDLR